MKIIIDPYKIYQPGKNTLLVNSELLYVRSRQALWTYFISGSTIYDCIHVMEHPFNQWYHDLQEGIEYVSPKTLLGEKFPGAVLPVDLSDNDIMEMDLLDMPIEPVEKEILKHFLGIVLPNEINHGNYYLSAYTLAQTLLINQRTFKYAFIAKAWQRNLTNALAESDEAAIRIFQPIIDRDEEYCKLLAVGLYGSKNQMFRKHWLEDILLEFHNRSISIEHIERILPVNQQPLLINDKNEAVLEKFLEQGLRSGKITLNDLSGYYPAELEAVLSTSKKIDQPSFDELVNRFGLVIDDRQRIGLRKLIIPELAGMPAITGLSLQEQADVLKRWAVESFIPYKFYYDEAGAVDPLPLALIETNAEKFGDWLFKNIGAILNQDEIFTNIDIVKNVRELIRDDSSVIWLIIDGLPAQYTEVLETILKSNGINRLQKNWSLATLPTITEVAMPITISGKYGQSINSTDSSNRRELLRTAFPGKATIYSSQPADFYNNLTKTFDVCCLHVREIDTEMHKNDYEFYDGRSAEIDRLLRKYIEVVAEVIRKNPERKLSLLVSTDHGATKCLANAQMIKSQKLNELAVSRPRERCVPLTEELRMENWEVQDIYMLSKTTAKNNFDWAIARGYKYFGRNDSGYRHGGLTPEEVIVPVIIGQILPVNAVKITMRSIGLHEFRFGKTDKNFKFRIKNNDPSSILINGITILEEKDASFELPLTVLANSEAELRGMIKLHARLRSASKDGKLPLNLAIKYIVLGDQFEDVLRIEVFTEKDEFEHDFI